MWFQWLKLLIKYKNNVGPFRPGAEWSPPRTCFGFLIRNLNPGFTLWVQGSLTNRVVDVIVLDESVTLSHCIMSELKDCPSLKYYDFKPVEHVKLCPRYTAVLGRSEDDGIGIEELDTLQLELETLLSSGSRRLRALEEQRQVHVSAPCATGLSAQFTILHILILNKKYFDLLLSLISDPHRLARQEGR